MTNVIDKALGGRVLSAPSSGITMASALTDGALGMTAAALATSTPMTTPAWLGFVLFAAAGFCSFFRGMTGAALWTRLTYSVSSLAASLGLMMFALAAMEYVGTGVGVFGDWMALVLGLAIFYDLTVTQTFFGNIRYVQWPSIMVIAACGFYGLFAGKFRMPGTSSSAKFLLLAASLFGADAGNFVTHFFYTMGVDIARMGLQRLLVAGGLIAMYFAAQAGMGWFTHRNFLGLGSNWW